MHINITYFTFAWPELLVGLIPMVCFFKEYRPRRWNRAAQWDATGWMLIVAIFYLSSMVQLIFGVHAPDKLSAIIDLILLALVDGLVIHRVIYYKRYKKYFNSLEKK